MFDLDNLRVDPEKANEGTWVNYRGGAKLKLAKFMNKEMQDYRVQKSLEHAKLLNDGGEEADKVAEEVTVYCLANFVLKDWEGFSQGEEELTYTPELGVKILSDEQFADFRDDLINLASSRDNYRPEDLKSASKAVKSQAAS